MTQNLRLRKCSPPMKQVRGLARSSLYLACLCLIAIGCQSLERSSQSGYRATQKESALRDFESGSAASDSPQSGGLARALGFTSDADIREQIRRSLKLSEASIEGRSEREQYYKIRHLLVSDMDRLKYLKLDESEREAFLRSKGIDGDNIAYTPEVQGLIANGDIALGMSKNAVRAAWGPPENIDVAGNPMYGHEIWHYSEQITSQDGYQTERRLVTFEGGLVVGWERK